MYIGAVLDVVEVLLLKQTLLAYLDPKPLGFIFETKSGMMLPHHMTINMGKFDDSLNDPSILGQEVRLEISKFLYNENICCAAVDSALLSDKTPVHSSNKNKHITMCLRPPTKPVESNKLFEKSSVLHVDPFVIYATVQEIE